MQSFFYNAPSNKYRYWLKANKLMIQMKDVEMKAFRSSKEGGQVERYVDIFAVGGGWYEITTKEGVYKTLPPALQEVLAPKAGYKVWVAALNTQNVGTVNANPTPFTIQRTKRIVQPTVAGPTQAKLAQLVSHFS